MRQPSNSLPVALTGCRVSPVRHVPFSRFVLIAVIVIAFHASGGLVHANALRILKDDCEAFQVRADLIQRASTQISLAYYAVDGTEVPVALLELVRQARQRGVRVRLLVDGLMTRMPSGFERYLKKCGVQVRVYHGTRHGKPLWLNRRLHDKLLITDSQNLLIGSRNLRNNHFGLAKENYIDCDAYLCGDIACKAQAYFDRLWSSSDVQTARRWRFHWPRSAEFATQERVSILQILAQGGKTFAISVFDDSSTQSRLLSAWDRAELGKGLDSRRLIPDRS